MKKFALLFICLSIASVDVTQAENTPEYRYPGREGIILAWNGSWDLGVSTFEGGIGYKRWISERVAVKTFVTLGRIDTVIVPDEDSYPPEYRLKEKSFSVRAGIEDHFWDRGRLSFFYGGVARFKTSSAKMDYEPYLSFEIDEEKITANVFAIQGSLGLEYFFSKRLSLSGWYQIDLSLGKQSRKETLVEGVNRPQPLEQKTTTWSIGTGTSLLTLTIYP
ncbi:MAG: hypothetical protein WBC88_12960 [Candidatus Zixiibacteriota bacterium]